MVKNSLKKINNDKVLLGYCKFNSKKIMNNRNIPKVILIKIKNFYTRQGHLLHHKNGLISKGYRQVLVYNYPKKFFKTLKKYTTKKLS